MVETDGATVIAARQPETKSLLDSIWGLLRDRELEVGERLPPIRELAAALGVNPTAVRDALHHAQAVGMVRILPRAGAFLQAPAPAPPPGDGLHGGRGPDEPNVFELLDARRLVEVELVGRAAERRRLEDLLPVRRALEAMLQLPEATSRPEYLEHDIRLHVETARLAGNAVLHGILQSLLGHLRPRLGQLRWTPEVRADADRAHTALYKALVAGDADKARAVMREHLSAAYDRLLCDLEHPPVVTGRHRRAGR